MSGGLSIDLFAENQASPTFQRIAAAIQRPDIRKVMGRAIAGEMRRNFTDLDRTRANEMGGQRTHFYAQARRGVQQPELDGDGVKVTTVHVGIAQRYFGGDIVPRQSRYLTIPTHPEAYGHRAREFALQAVFFPGGTGVLAERDDDSKTGLGAVFYRLLRRVRQEPDETVLPSAEDMQQAAAQAGAEYIDVLAERAKG